MHVVLGKVVGDLPYFAVRVRRTAFEMYIQELGVQVPVQFSKPPVFLFATVPSVSPRREHQCFLRAISIHPQDHRATPLDVRVTERRETNERNEMLPNLFLRKDLEEAKGRPALRDGAFNAPLMRRDRSCASRTKAIRVAKKVASAVQKSVHSSARRLIARS